MDWGGKRFPGVINPWGLINSRAIPSDFEDPVYRGVRTEIFSEIVAISAASNLSVIDATGQIHSLLNPELQKDEIEHSPSSRQVDGAIKGLRLRKRSIRVVLYLDWPSSMFSWRRTMSQNYRFGGFRMWVSRDWFCRILPKEGIAHYWRQFPDSSVRHLSTKTDISVIDIENELEIWAEEMESDYEYEIDEGYDGALLDLDVRTIDGISIFFSKKV